MPLEGIYNRRLLVRLSHTQIKPRPFTFSSSISLTHKFENRMLIIEYVAATATDHDAQKALERKDKRPLPIPVSI